MKEGIFFGFCMGLICGALIVSSSSKAEQFVEKGKKAIKKQIEKMK